MKFIALEGLDGAGKSTQLKLLKEWFTSKELKFEYLHFPRTESPFYGEMVAKFLRGDFGKLDEVDPYLVAILYAGDRKDASAQIENAINKETYVIVDRYVYSNIAYQCAKLTGNTEKETLKDWILNLEFDYNKIIKPDISIFLDVPFEFTKNSLSNNRGGDDRAYLNGKEDIHESSLQFQLDVKDVYTNLLETQTDFFNVSCFNEDNNMLKPDLIFSQITDLLIKNKIV